ncbi:hypothetical protein ACIPVB_06175 [Microbacterium sp. NPDC090007]|uniref:hypothetical protein n=1 Tax=Microbacterium sp. NPDC090007 TaxID=3364204 RepID=UPI0037FA397A
MHPGILVARRRNAVTAAATAVALVFGVFFPTSQAAASLPVSTASSAVIASGPAYLAADLSQFRAGNIISNAVFYDSSTMSEGQIDAFLRARVAACQSGYTCLKDFRQTTTTRAADAYCGKYEGAAQESSARIIQKVAAACGINPQVLIVTLQKEQGLVTHTWPSDWRYTSAMGQGCPDTAACDSRYYGFFNQVYGAARQFKLYGQSSYFTWYAPGKTWNVLFHPNQSCGSSPVYIENQATANLYYYTPYQPNAAALRAGYGEGDGCSAYGNRNFFNYFNDWFGSTQSAPIRDSSLVKSSDADEIYLVAGTTRRHVLSQLDLSALSVRLGGVQVVRPSQITALTTAPPATRLVRDARDGSMYLIEADGSKHHFQSAATVRGYGFSMDNYLSLPPAVIDSYGTGAPVGDAFRAADSPDYYVWAEGARHWVMDGLAWSQDPASTSGYVAVLAPEAVTRLPVGLPRLGGGTLVAEKGRPEIYISGYGAEIVHIPSWAIAAELGVGNLRTFPAGSLDPFTRAAESLAPVVSCGGTSFLVAGGGLNQLTERLGTPLVLTDDLCRALPKTGRTVSTPVFIGTSSSPDIFAFDGSALRHIRDTDTLRRLAGNSPVVVTQWSADMTVSVPRAAPHLSEGTLVSFGDDRIFVSEKGIIRHVLSWATVIRLSPDPSPKIEPLPLAYYTQYEEGEPLP